MSKIHIDLSIDAQNFTIFKRIVPNGSRSKVINQLIQEYCSFRQGSATIDNKEYILNEQKKIESEIIKLNSQLTSLKEDQGAIEQIASLELTDDERDWLSVYGVNIAKNNSLQNSFYSFRQQFGRYKYPFGKYKEYIDAFLTKDKEVTQ